MDWKSDRSSADDRLGVGNGATSAPDHSPSEPVTAVMNIRPKRASVGETFEVVVHTRIASVHFIHAKDDAGGPFAPVDVSIIIIITCNKLIDIEPVRPRVLACEECLKTGATWLLRG
jgi:hypothetical protein